MKLTRKGQTKGEVMKGKHRVLIFTGDGKGKTTAAFGMALRASGEGKRTLIVQFIKPYSSVGEVAACCYLPSVEIRQTGLGFVPGVSHPSFTEHRQAAQKGFELALKAMMSDEYDLIILDEVCTAVAKGLLEEDQIKEALLQAHPGVCLVMTGRDATAGLIDLADTVTEMHSVKHGSSEGWKAQKGVEY